MNRLSRLRLSLRLKLILSYLGVALGAILVLTIVISFAVQNYFYSTQRDLLDTRANLTAQQIVQLYGEAGSNWDNVGPLRLNSSELFVVVDATDQRRSLPTPSYFKLSEVDIPVLQQALTQALQGQEVNGNLQGSADINTFSGQYVSLPLRTDGQIIGALLLAEPTLYPQGFSPNEFLVNVNQAVLLTGFLVALVVFIFSFLLARSLTRPLESLTLAAAQMKSGDYTQRVAPPKAQDELGKLASTFNAMADQIASDVTELRHQEQLRRDLIANIAHDLITPLTAIQGLSEALADEVIAESKVRQETAQLIGREVQRLRRLVGEMQHMSSLESGQMTLDLAPLDMHTLVDEMLAVIEPECRQVHISVCNELVSTLPAVLADSDRITQVLLNLLDNARHHTPAGGKLTVGAEAQGKALAVWVNDTGVGIDPVDLPHIFERFYRVDRARVHPHPVGRDKSGPYGSGSGLGLAIVKAIITAHGGTIHAESTPGQGTRILFTLPLASAEQVL